MSTFWFGSGSDAATCRAIVEHARLIDAADLSFPIILSSDGRVTDGMHRVAKAALLGHETIAAVQFASDCRDRTLWTFSQMTSRTKILLMKHRESPNHASEVVRQTFS